MSSTTVYRLSGIALLIAGLVGPLEAILSAVWYPDHDATAQQILSFPWMFVASLYLAAFLLLAVGLPGMYRRQARRAGRWGLVGFILTMIGVVVGGVALGLLQVLTFPQQAQADPKSVQAPPSPAAYALFVLVPVILIAGGAILLSIGSLRASIFPRGAGLLLLIAGISGLISLAAPSTIGNVLEALWNALLFLAFGWFGYALVIQKERVTTTEGVQPQAQPIRTA